LRFSQPQNKTERGEYMTPELKQKLDEKARLLRRHILEMVGGESGRGGHLGGSNSAADIVAALYFHKMKVNPANPKDEDRDRFLLSKGHAALVQYAALAVLGFFPVEELKNVKALGSMLQGHPDMTLTPGVEANTGSLGMGLSIGLGIALGLELDKNRRKVYVIIGDGELAEGQIWEAVLAAAHYKTQNLVAIVDYNKVQAMGPTSKRMNIDNLREKFTSFGWHAMEIDGHNITEICTALDAADNITDKPVVIIADTIKGKGVSYAEGQAAFHNVPLLTPEQYETAAGDIAGYVCR
jgi:transketolase